MSSSCPACGNPTRKVSALTVRSLVRAERLDDLPSADGFRFCDSERCQVAYWSPDADHRIDVADVTVPIFHKDASAERLVCYCFGYDAAAVTEQGEGGSTEILDDITARCRADQDRCEEMNPQGACCLGNVRSLMQREQNLEGAETPDCCQPVVEPTAVSVEPAGWLFGVGALAAAALSSACCWLPLVLIGAGASTLGVGSFLEDYRGTLLGATGLLLGTGFYFAYIRKPRCAPGDSCAEPNPRLRKISRAALWIATCAAAAFALFPNYLQAMAGAESSDIGQQELSNVATRTFSVGGLTCAGCAPLVREALMAVPGVLSAEVSYAEKTARVMSLPSQPVDPSALVAAVDELGFSLGEEIQR